MTRKNLLITLRQPGPVQAIMGIFDTLYAHFQLKIILSNHAIDFMQSRYEDYLSEYPSVFYVPVCLAENQNKYLIKILQTADSVHIESAKQYTEMNPEETPCIQGAIDVLRCFLTQHPIDIYLRTTPVGKLGLDEILPTLIYTDFPTIKTYAYQDYYGVGLLLEDNQHPILTRGVDKIAVVDGMAALQCHEHNPLKHVQVVGWSAHAGLLNNLTHHKQQQVFPNKKKRILYAITYCADCPMSDVANFQALMASFSKIDLDNVSIFIKAHPRMPSSIRQEYDTISLSLNVPMIWVEEWQGTYADNLADMDVVVSSASGVNLDFLAIHAYLYQTKNRKVDYPLSIYLATAMTNAILQHSIGYGLLPTHTQPSGSLILNEADLQSNWTSILDDDQAKQSIFQTAMRMYTPKQTGEEMVAFLLDYQVQVCQQGMLFFHDRLDETERDLLSQVLHHQYQAHDVTHFIIDTVYRDFSDKALVTFRLPDDSVVAQEIVLPSRLQKKLSGFCFSQAKKAINFSRLGQPSPLCVMACYRWKPKTDLENIRHAMTQHFEKELAHPWFQSFQFNEIGFTNLGIDFIFQGWIKDKEAIGVMRADPALQEMQAHAERFLDERSKMSALLHIEGASFVYRND